MTAPAVPDPAAPAAPEPAREAPVSPASAASPAPPAAPTPIPEPAPAAAQVPPAEPASPEASPDPAAPAAPTPSEPSGFTPEVRASLTGLLGHERFRPVEAPAGPDDLTDEELTAFHEQYSKAENDQQAFRLMFNKNREYVRRSILAEQQREQTHRQNSQRAAGLLQAVHQQVTTVLTNMAPDVAPDLFWAWAAPAAAQETPAHLTTPIDRWEWQLKRGVQLYRERFGVSKAPPADPDPNATRRAATAVMPAGSVQPRGGSPAKPRSFVDQLATRQARIMPGAPR